jgi:DNA adenine methylase
MHALLTGVAKCARINDIDPGIAAFWKVLFEGSDTDYRLLKRLIKHPPTVEDFEKVREDVKRDDCGIVERAFHAFYLNKTTYGGLGTSGCLGGEAQDKTTIDSRYNAARFIEEMDRLRALKGSVTVTCGDFADCIAQAKPGDVIYADPPYVEAGDDLYAKPHQRMTEGDHERLAAVLDDAHRRGVRFMCSYDDTAQTRERYKAYYKAYTVSVQPTRCATGKIKNELLITNFPFAEAEPIAAPSPVAQLPVVGIK